MVRSFLAAASASALLIGAPPASAASKVYVSQTGDDQVGRAIVFRLGDEIARSGSFSVSAIEPGADFEIRVTAIPMNSLGLEASAYSAVALSVSPAQIERTFVASMVGYCGSTSAAVCSASIFESLGPAMQHWNAELFSRAAIDAALRKPATK